MIKLADHKVELLNLPVTIQALKDVDELIEHYSRPNLCVAYCNVMTYKLQLEPSIFLEALRQQRARMVEYLATLGIEA